MTFLPQQVMSPGSATPPGRQSCQECPEKSPSSTYGDSAHKRRSHNPGAASVINVVSAKRHARATKCASCGSCQYLGGPRHLPVGSHQVYRSLSFAFWVPEYGPSKIQLAVENTSVDALFIQHRSSTFLTFWAQVRFVKQSVKLASVGNQ
jgi:hypothetical protein